jgi:hypothetical protein
VGKADQFYASSELKKNGSRGDMEEEKVTSEKSL